MSTISPINSKILVILTKKRTSNTPPLITPCTIPDFVLNLLTNKPTTKLIPLAVINFFTGCPLKQNSIQLFQT